MSPIIRAFFGSPTGSLQYVFHCAAKRTATILDPVWNIHREAEAITTQASDEILAYVATENLKVLGVFSEDEEFMLGEIPVCVMFSPGHKLAATTYVVGDAAFVHDTLMMPESGTSRADFPGGSAKDLWNSLRAILDLSSDTRLYIGHDYPDSGAAPEYMATVAEHRLRNRHVKDGIGKAEFIATRAARDATLTLPERMLAALQVNIWGGRLPEPEADGHSYLKIPVGKFDPR